MVKEFEHKDLWALILGGSGGLGLATAKKLAAHGCHIIIVHRDRKADQDQIEQEFEQIRSLGVSLLSYNEDAILAEKRKSIIRDIKEKISDTGKIRVLVHSIARGNLKPMTGDEGATLSNDDFRVTIEYMAISLYDWTRSVFEEGLFADDARIISFTSEGNQKALKNYAAVSAAKAALEAITRNIAGECASYGIRANCIQAGVTDTASFRMIPGYETIQERSQKRNPFNRITTPEDVAGVAYLLCRDEAAWINGTIIIADGGEHIH